MEQVFFSTDTISLYKNGIILEPLTFKHQDALQVACKDGELWRLRVTSAPHYTDVTSYIETALLAKEKYQRFPFAVLQEVTGRLIGTTSYHDILPDVLRLEVGYTWYAHSFQRTSVNTTCKLLLLEYAFEKLGAKTVGLRTDIFNLRSQRAIERIGAKKDGIIRGNALRKDGTVRDTVMYSIIAGEWESIKDHLNGLLTNQY